MTDKQVITEIMGHLRTIYGNNIPNPRQMLHAKWSSNINSYDSYSFTTNSTRTTNFDVLAKEVNNKLS